MISETRRAVITLIISFAILVNGWSQTVELNPKSGIYNSSIDVEIVSNGQFEKICYSLDGSEPDANSPIYKNPIRIDKNLVLKVSSIDKNGAFTNISVASYFIDPQHSLPIVSLITDPKYMWDEEKGIYVKGLNSEATFPYYGANFWQDWEIPVHIEMFEPDGTLAFSLFAGAKIFGGFTRAYPQRSLSIHTRKSYGKKNINYQIFPDRNLDKFSRVVLRNSGNDWNHSMIRDGVISKLFHPSIDQQAFRSAVLYINGTYWGIHNIREKINEEYIESHYGISEDDITILESSGLPVHGDNKEYKDLIAFVENHDLTIQENYDYIESKIDINNFIYYQTGNIYIDNRDWPASNKKYWKQNSDSGKWRWISYDRDFGFGYSDINKVFLNTLEFALEPDGPDWPNPPWSNILLRSLIKNESFRKSFINSFADQLNTLWRADNVLNNIQNLKGKIDNEILRHQERWNGSVDFWQMNIWWMNEFARRRPDIMFSHIQTTFDIAQNHQVTLEVNKDQSGRILLNGIEPEQYPWAGKYFQGIPVSLTAKPEPGYRFSKWEGEIQSSDEQIEVDLNRDMTIIAVFELENEALSSIVINEIFYKSEEKDINDWIELFNRGQSNVDLSNWTFNDENHPEGFKIPSNTVIQPGNFILIARDKENFQEVYGDNFHVFGDFNFGLSSFGECLRILDYNGNLADEVCYLSTFPWPDTKGGASLALLDPEKSNSYNQNWFANDHKGSPGKINKLPDPDVSFTIFPNPARDYVIVNISSPLTDTYFTSIYDAIGNIIDNRIFHNSERSSFKINFSNTIQPGIYFVTVASNNSIVSKRLLIK